MQQRVARLVLCAVFALLLASCASTSSTAPASATPAPTATPRPTGTASSAATAAAARNATATAESTATAAVTPAATDAAGLQPLPLYIRIANTDGEGVAVRDACDDAARISARGEGIPDASRVEFLTGGRDECAGWMQVRDDKNRESWVRAQFLAPLPAEDAGGGATTAAATAATPAATTTVHATRTGSRAYYYGYAPPGTTVAADIDGEECGATVTNADGEWLIFIYQDDCDGGAVRNAIVGFTINGARANETETWSNGGGPEDVRYGVTLTVVPSQ